MSFDFCVEFDQLFDNATAEELVRLLSEDVPHWEGCTVQPSRMHSLESGMIFWSEISGRNTRTVSFYSRSRTFFVFFSHYVLSGFKG